MLQLQNHIGVNPNFLKTPIVDRNAIARKISIGVAMYAISPTNSGILVAKSDRIITINRGSKTR